MLNKHNNISTLTKQYLAARRPFLKESSYAHYSELAENYIEPYIGTIHFEKLDGKIIENYISKLKTNGKTSGVGGLSDKTIRDIWSLLKSIYIFAADTGCCSSDIRFPRLTVLKPQRMRSQILSATHQKQLEIYLMREQNPECKFRFNCT